jgi:hypothetical protein
MNKIIRALCFVWWREMRQNWAVRKLAESNYVKPKNYRLTITDRDTCLAILKAKDNLADKFNNNVAGSSIVGNVECFELWALVEKVANAADKPLPRGYSFEIKSWIGKVDIIGAPLEDALERHWQKHLKSVRDQMLPEPKESSCEGQEVDPSVPLPPFPGVHPLYPPPGLWPLDGIGDHMPMADWLSCVRSGGFIDYDGYGHLATATNKSENVVRPSDVKLYTMPEWATHVVWYNR